VPAVASGGGSCRFLFSALRYRVLDRMNVGAAALQMHHDLGFSEGVIGMGAGISSFWVTSYWKSPER